MIVNCEDSKRITEVCHIVDEKYPDREPTNKLKKKRHSLITALFSNNEIYRSTV